MSGHTPWSEVKKKMSQEMQDRIKKKSAALEWEAEQRREAGREYVRSMIADFPQIQELVAEAGEDIVVEAIRESFADGSLGVCHNCRIIAEREELVRHLVEYHEIPLDLAKGKPGQAITYMAVGKSSFPMTFVGMDSITREVRWIKEVYGRAGLEIPGREPGWGPITVVVSTPQGVEIIEPRHEG